MSELATASATPSEHIRCVHYACCVGLSASHIHHTIKMKCLFTNKQEGRQATQKMALDVIDTTHHSLKNKNAPVQDGKVGFGPGYRRFRVDPDRSCPK